MDPGPAARLDRLPLTRLHIAVMALCALGFTFDLMEVALGGALSAIFSSPPHTLAASDLAWLLASMYVGAVVGAPLMGWVADRYGRRSALTLVLAWLAVTSVMAAASPDATALTVSRGLSGIALGAWPPLMIAYLTDLLPPGRRGMLIFLTVAAAAVGPPAGIFLVRWLTTVQPLGLEAWRWAYVAGAIGSTGVALAFRFIPESPRWLAVVGRHDEAEAQLQRFERSRVVALPPARASEPGPRRVLATAEGGAGGRASPLHLVRMACLYFLSPWSTAAFPLLMGAVLAGKGFRLSDTLLFVGVSTFGPLVGTLLTAGFVDRIERRTALIACAAAMLVCGTAFAMSDLPAWLMATSLIYTLIATLYVPVINLYGSETFPTQSRATLSAVAWAFNRLGAAIAPLLLLPLLRSEGSNAMSGVNAATLAASIVLLLFSPVGRARRRID